MILINCVHGMIQSFVCVCAADELVRFGRDKLAGSGHDELAESGHDELAESYIDTYLITPSLFKTA